MLPKRMNELLHDLLPEHVWQSCRKEEAGLVFMEFTSQDVELLHRLGIEVDNLGPRLVVYMRDERIARCNLHKPSTTTDPISMIDNATAASRMLTPNQRYAKSAG